MGWRNARLGGNVLPGWEPLVDELYSKLSALDPNVKIDQVKEKFGGLRFYWSSPILPEVDKPDPRHVMVSEYEARSFDICEVCGAPGSLSPGMRGWVKTLCPKHVERYMTGLAAWQIVEEEQKDANLS